VDLETLLDLFGLSIAATLISGALVPAIGVQLFVRRTSFLGIALPQFAACGVAAAFAAQALWPELGESAVDHGAPGHVHHSLPMHVMWAVAFTLGGLGLLTLADRRGIGSRAARVAAAFATAGAATILFAHLSPWGEVYVGELLDGQLLTVGSRELAWLVIAISISTWVLFSNQKDLDLIAFDRDTARVQGVPILRLELTLAVAAGLTISVGTLTVGPVVLFGLLALPPLAARPLARSMRSFLVISGIAGVTSALLGLWASFGMDLPLGPCVVLAGACTALPGLLLGAARAS
jgi:ABC-type Mn2+/Zn2+ transport system permease subunit